MRPTRGLIVLGGTSSALAASPHCPPLGAVLPAPKAPSSNAAVIQAVQAFGDVFSGLTETLNSTAISIGVQSLHEDKPLLELFFTPPNTGDRGVKQVDADTVYRIGSLSKLFPVLSLLKITGVSLDDPVTKYLPRLLELKNEQAENNDVTTVNWDQVTLAGLASHTSGIASDFLTDLTATLGKAGVALGLPNVTDTSVLAACAGLFGLPPCNDTDLYTFFGKRPPVYAPFSTPVYSNIGFSILGLVVEAASNMTFADFVQKNILDEAAMTKTSLTVPSADTGFIAENEVWWDASLGLEIPAGGIFSTITDMLTFGTSILGNRFLTSTQTRKWLKPLTSTSSFGTAIGAAWEILRSETVTDDGRLVEFYTKAGDLGFYHSHFVLVPDYDMTIVVMTSGPESSPEFSEQIVSKVVQGLLPAIEQAGKDEATASFAGSYVDSVTNSSLQLSLDDGPGLVVEQWVVRGVNVFENYFSYTGSAAPSPLPPVAARLYPTNLAAGNQTAWRAVFEVGTAEDLASAVEPGLFWQQSGCVTWAKQDRLSWVYNSLDEFVFTTEDAVANPVAESVILKGFEVSLTRSCTKRRKA